ncbi:MAG: hypothetical protein R2875_11690 [Desulfobacterales bacterium]
MLDDIAVTVYGPLIAAISHLCRRRSGDFRRKRFCGYHRKCRCIALENNHFEMSDSDAGLFCAFCAQDNSAFTLAVTGNNFQAADNEGYLAYTYNWSENAPRIVEMPENWWGTSDARGLLKRLYTIRAVDYQLPEIDFQPIEGKDQLMPAHPALSPDRNAGPGSGNRCGQSCDPEGSGSYDPALPGTSGSRKTAHLLPFGIRTSRPLHSSPLTAARMARPFSSR